MNMFRIVDEILWNHSELLKSKDIIYYNPLTSFYFLVEISIKTLWTNISLDVQIQNGYLNQPTYMYSIQKMGNSVVKNLILNKF